MFEGMSVKISKRYISAGYEGMSCVDHVITWMARRQLKKGYLAFLLNRAAIPVAIAVAATGGAKNPPIAIAAAAAPIPTAPTAAALATSVPSANLMAESSLKMTSLRLL